MDTLLSLVIYARKRLCHHMTTIRALLLTAFAALLLGMSSLASANVTITATTGGSAIPSNTTAGCSAAGTWTALTGPVIKEGDAGEISKGNIVLTAPAGFEFNTAATVTILLNGVSSHNKNINNDYDGGIYAVTSITSTQITFRVFAISTTPNTLTWQGIQVRPTASAPLASGNITETGSSDLNGANSTTNFGTLTEVNSSPVCNSNPVPTTTSISPASGYVGDAGFTMTVNGTNFISSSQARIGGANRTTTYISATQLSVAILASDLTSAATYNIDVVNPAPGGGTSNAQTFNVINFCTPPSNIPSGVQVGCQCDTFSRSTLNPSTIFGANWIVSTSDSTGIVPSIVNTGYLRLTNNTGNNAKAVTVPGIFPAAGNYISVEFKHYAYNGTGADGVAVTLSDYSVPAVPGAYGGSLGYAQETGIHDGFAGGWIGVGIDEYGNYQNTNEGRLGGPGLTVESVGIRGSGSGQLGYNWLGGTATLSPIVDNRGSTTASPGYYYQVIVDARNAAATAVAVNRDTTGTGTSYTQLIGTTNVFTTATGLGFTQAPVPANWQISFTGSTGGSTNIHEIGAVRICASSMAPPTGGTAGSFNAIDSAYGIPPSVAVQNYLTGHLYTKLMGTPFKLNVAALNNNQIVTTYAASSTKTVTVKLVDNSDSLAGSPNYFASAANCTQSCTSACTSKTAVTGGSQTLSFTSSNKGQQQTANFTLNSAYQKLVAIISDGTTTACSTDAFSVRPLSVTSVTSNATNTGTTGTPVIKAGTNFSLAATIAGVTGNPNGYTGVLQINSAAVQSSSPATVAGALTGTFPAAVSGTPSSTASGTTFTYGEVGQFFLLGPNYTASPSISPGVYDNTWTSIDSGVTQNDCNSTTAAAAYSNTIDASGKYGCYFGIATNTGAYGRFVPDHFALSPSATLITRNDLSCSPASTFTYMDEPMATTFTLTAQNATNGTTQNYAGVFAKLDLANPVAFGFGAINNAATKTPLTPRLSLVSTSGSWTGGVATGISGVLAVSSQSGPATPRTGAPDGPFDLLDLGIAPSDADGVQLPLSGALNLDVDNNGSMDHASLGRTAVRFGRLKLNNAFGSELLDLPIPAEAQYWNGTVFVTNTADNCTVISATNIAMGNYLPNLSACETAISISGRLSAGKSNLKLVKPGAGNNGSVDLTVNLGITATGQTCVAPLPATQQAAVAANQSYLQGKWTGTSYNQNPHARATFGVYKNANEFIYMREMY